MIRAAALLTVALSLPLPARAGAPPAAGHIESEDATVEILGTPRRAGERIELPEGFIQLDEQGTEDGQAGSFSVVPAETFGGATVELEPEPQQGPPPPGAPAADACGPERSAYVATLWRMAGIDVSDPAALLEGLAGGSAYWALAVGADPYRPLAWSSDLRSRAEALVACVRQHHGG